jgi:hypothetical protein
MRRSTRWLPARPAREWGLASSWQRLCIHSTLLPSDAHCCSWGGGHPWRTAYAHALLGWRMAGSRPESCLLALMFHCAQSRLLFQGGLLVLQGVLHSLVRITLHHVHAQRTNCRLCLSMSFQAFCHPSLLCRSEAGTYQPKTGQAACLVCPDGKYQPGEGSSSCLTCK